MTYDPRSIKFRGGVGIT